MRACVISMSFDVNDDRDDRDDAAANAENGREPIGAPEQHVGSEPGSEPIVHEDPAAGCGSPLAGPSGLVSLRGVLGYVRKNLRDGTAPIMYAVATEPWGTFAFRPGQMLAIAAQPGIGKTAFIVQAVVDALRLHPEATCLMVNVEMEPATLIERQIARLTGIDLSDITMRRNLTFRQREIDAAFVTLDALSDRLFFMEPRFTMDRVWECVEAVKPTIVVLDYIQRIECCDGVADTRQRLNNLVNEARRLAATGICVVEVSAIGRTSSKQNGGYNRKEIGLGSFRESSEIEYGVDDAYVMVYGSDEPNHNGTRVIELRHVKCRNARPAHLKFDFCGPSQRFTFKGEIDDAAKSSFSNPTASSGGGHGRGAASRQPASISIDDAMDPFGKAAMDAMAGEEKGK